MKTYIQIMPAAKDFIKKLSKSKNKKEKKEALEVLEIIKKEDAEGFIKLNKVLPIFKSTTINTNKET